MTTARLALRPRTPRPAPTPGDPVRALLGRRVIKHGPFPTWWTKRQAQLIRPTLQAVDDWHQQQGSTGEVAVSVAKLASTLTAQRGPVGQLMSRRMLAELEQLGVLTEAGRTPWCRLYTLPDLLAPLPEAQP